ncbi:MAG: HAD-IC family P-type ATPase [Candidatus Nomurabacteria bacterium]|jgi:H+-transporting ATPase|nr:HAD-IC family P-type ATPase [Candidatus Nomurabacteria bacterium]
MKNEGLSSKDVATLLKKYGANVVRDKSAGFGKKYLLPLVSPISLMLIAAAVLSYFNNDKLDALFIILLYFLNYFIGQWQTHKADKSIAKLQESLKVMIKVKRDGEWKEVISDDLVPGDVVALGLGSIIPADGEILSSDNLALNEAALTGESLPQEKAVGDKIWSGTFVATGDLTAQITATGGETRFGKTIMGIDTNGEKSILEKDIMRISKFLSVLAIIAVAILTVAAFLRHESLALMLTLDLSLLIAGIPIALPAVMAVILSIGASVLAHKKVIVRRLSALEDLSNVNLLLSDKTGTLTTGEIAVTGSKSYSDKFSDDDIIALANMVAHSKTPDAIDSAIHLKAHDIKAIDAEVEKFVPYNGDNKRATVTVKYNGEEYVISSGAAQIVAKDNAEILKSVAEASGAGFRTLAVGVGKNEDDVRAVGLLYLADPLRKNSAETIRFMQKSGIAVKMVTGDNHLIAAKIAGELGLNGVVLTRDDMNSFSADVFSEILPSDKQKIVEHFQKAKYVVASTGDGVNDLPALKTANVGIAVSNAVPALKSAADIVLLKDGLGVIRDAIIEARKIFERLYNYSVYRISESSRVIVTILILGLAIGSYPLDPLQLILLAVFNDIPIMSLATDRVKASGNPAKINNSRRLKYALTYGFLGIASSLALFFIMYSWWGLPMNVVKTMFFLKLTVSGHLLIYVAHTDKRWWKFLPSRGVIFATLGTQFVASILAFTGFLMPTPISLGLIGIVWLWSIIWMQISEFGKWILQKIVK